MLQLKTEIKYQSAIFLKWVYRILLFFMVISLIVPLQGLLVGETTSTTITDLNFMPTILLSVIFLLVFGKYRKEIKSKQKGNSSSKYANVSQFLESCPSQPLTQKEIKILKNNIAKSKIIFVGFGAIVGLMLVSFFAKLAPLWVIGVLILFIGGFIFFLYRFVTKEKRLVDIDIQNGIMKIVEGKVTGKYSRSSKSGTTTGIGITKYYIDLNHNLVANVMENDYHAINENDEVKIHITPRALQILEINKI